MTIVQTLAKDIADILAIELACDTLDMNRLYCRLLLLIGHNRSAGKKRASRNKIEASNFDGEEYSGEEDFSDKAEHEPKPEADTRQANHSSGQQVAAITRLRQELPVFDKTNPYINKLLFKDYYLSSHECYESYHLPSLGNLSVHREAARYIDEVLLLRPLRLATSNGDKPTNMHLLLLLFCKLSQTEGHWESSHISRSRDGQTRIPGWFEKKAELLAKQKRAEQGKISAVAVNRSDESGPYWFEAKDCRTQVGEELPLNFVLEMAPTPLQPELSKNATFVDLLSRIVEALNKRYTLLRSCGLPPEEWLPKEKPSIDGLEKLIKLRKTAKTLMSVGENRPPIQCEYAYEQAFNQVRHELSVDKIAGFSSFEEWRQSPVGNTMMERSQLIKVSMNDLFEDEDIEFDVEDKNAISGESAQLSESFFSQSFGLIKDNPTLIKFISETLINERPFLGQDGLCNDPDFTALAETNPAYKNLADADLADGLFVDTKHFIFSGLLQDNAQAINPVLETFIRRVMVEEQPFRGKEGLFNKTSFKRLLSNSPEFAGLSADDLQEQLEAKAHRLMLNLIHQQK